MDWSMSPLSVELIYEQFTKDKHFRSTPVKMRHPMLHAPSQIMLTPLRLNDWMPSVASKLPFVP
jgi:hypothetical protein